MNSSNNSSKRVLHILASNSFSGAENVVCTIIENSKDKYEMAYCSPDGPIEDTLKEKNINYYGLDKLNIKNINKVINEFKPDIIHAHDYKASYLASLFGKQIKVISHIHGNNKIMNKINIFSFLYKFVSNRFYKIIWVSESSLNDYYFKNSIKNKSVIIENVINDNIVKEKTLEYEINDNYDLIYLGRLDYPKNPERLIEIIQLIKNKNKDIKAAIVGDGSKRKEIEDLIKNNSLENNVKMYGFQKNPYPVLKKSKMLIMTSLYEGTPMSALEAQALGKPIISTPVDGLKNIIVNDKNGYLTDDNNEMCDKILEILNNEELYKSMSNYSIEQFNKINNLKEYINKIYEIYQ